MIPTHCSVCNQLIRLDEDTRYNPRTGTIRHPRCRLPGPAPVADPPPVSVTAQRPIAFTPEEQ